MKKIAILGSTGSIGTQTLDVVREHSDELQVVALAAGTNKERLKEQIKEFHPKLVSLSDEKKAQELKEELAGEQVEVVCGMEGLIEVAGADSADVVVTAVVGMMGILPTMEAIKNLNPLYEKVISDIKSVSEELIDTSNWKGDARDEFKDTYRIVEHYLEDDSEKISSISDMLKGFKDIYDAVDGDSAKKLYETVSDAVSGDKKNK